MPQFKKVYTGIGSRETPQDVLDLMERAGRVLAHHGWTLRSGHAQGADQAFERGASTQGGRMEIYLPWEGFESAKHDGQSYFTGFPDVTTAARARSMAARFHPRWNFVGPGARNLHTRSVPQVLGRTLEEPSDFIICWTKYGQRTGGTGQALRIAEHYRVPIFDLALVPLASIERFLNYGEVP